MEAETPRHTPLTLCSSAMSHAHVLVTDVLRVLSVEHRLRKSSFCPYRQDQSFHLHWACQLDGSLKEFTTKLVPQMAGVD